MDNRKRILVVEDDRDEEQLILEALRENQLSELVTAVRGGAEALDYLFCTGLHARRSPLDLPDLILLDLHMSGVSGIEVLDRIRADPRVRLIPVVVFSGSDSHRDLVASYLGGANSFVQKPVEFADYAEVLRHVWHYWSSVNAALPYAEEQERGLPRPHF